MAKVQRANQQARHDLVAHAQHQRGIEHIVAQRHGGGHGNGVAAEQAQLHARCALGHAIAHGGHAAGHLRGGAVLAGFFLDQVGVMLQRRVGREHVVVGVDDADVGAFFGHDLEFVQPGNAGLVAIGHGGKGVGHVGAAHAVGAGFALGGQRRFGPGRRCGWARCVR